MITIQHTRAVPIPYTELMDPVTGRTEVRMVNIDSFAYRSASKFMIRLSERDFQNEALLSKIADHVNISAKAFVERFGYLGGVAPRPF
jgi:6-phosphofructokinase 1